MAKAKLVLEFDTDNFALKIDFNGHTMDVARAMLAQADRYFDGLQRSDQALKTMGALQDVQHTRKVQELLRKGN